MEEPSKTLLSLKPEDALFSGQVNNLVVTLYENERPPGALAGILDWHCFGKISYFLRSGALTGKQGECSVFPIIRRNSHFNLVLLGAGPSSKLGARSPLPSKTLQVLQKNLISLKLSKVGVSKSDFGFNDPEQLSKQLKGVSLWITL